MAVGVTNDNSFKELALNKNVFTGFFIGLKFCSDLGREVHYVLFNFTIFDEIRCIIYCFTVKERKCQSHK